MQQRYSSLHQWLHWTTALCLFALMPIAWVMIWLKEDSRLTFVLHSWHETLGLIVLLGAVVRIVSRVIDRPPPLPGRLPKWERALARSTYILIYAVLIWMPVTGYLMATAYGFPPKLFNLVNTPALFAKSDSLAKAASTLHAYGQWLVYCLLLLHISGVVFHLMFRKSGVLGRMLPPNATEPIDQSTEPSDDMVAL